MDVIIGEEIKNNIKLELGDIIHHNHSFYLVMTLDGRYIAKNLNGSTGLFGIFDSLRQFNEKFNQLKEVSFPNATVYKARDYSLKLVKKDMPVTF